MKTLTALLSLLLCLNAQAVPLSVVSNITADPSKNQILTFDAIWGAGPGPQTTTFTFPHSPCLVSKIQLIDLGDAGGLALYIEIDSIAGPGGLGWVLGPYRYGIDSAHFDRSLTALHSDLFPSPLFPFTSPPLSIDVAELPGEPYGGRFTFSSDRSLLLIPDSGSTFALLLLAVPFLAFARKLT